jgi:hypothetical protein
MFQTKHWYLPTTLHGIATQKANSDLSVVVFLVVAQCSFVGDNQYFRGTYMFLKNVGNHLQDYTVSQPARPQLTLSPP